jgi:excisionase family DNA binding protein
MSRGTVPATGGELVVVSRDDLREMIRDAVREALESGEHDAEWLDAAGVAKLVKVHAGSVLRLVKTRGLPVHYVGRLARFNRAEVLAWMRHGPRA